MYRFRVIASCCTRIEPPKARESRGWALGLVPPSPIDYVVWGSIVCIFGIFEAHRTAHKKFNFSWKTTRAGEHSGLAEGGTRPPSWLRAWCGLDITVHNYHTQHSAEQFWQSNLRTIITVRVSQSLNSQLIRYEGQHWTTCGTWRFAMAHKSQPKKSEGLRKPAPYSEWP